MSEKLLTPTQLFTLKEPGEDLNTCLPGIYKIKSPNTIKNTPTNGYGILITIKEEDTESSVMTYSQIFFGLAGGSNTPETVKIYWRNRLLTYWGKWASYKS